MRNFILIGFKSVGKTVIGRLVALALKKSFIDLDDVIVERYELKEGVYLACREIMQRYGEDYFRELERGALQQVLREYHDSVIAIGGGAPMSQANRDLLKGQCLIFVTADKRKVYERIMAGGRPAFFPSNEDPWIFFLRLWEEREKVYKEISSCVVENNGRPEDAAEKIVNLIKNFKI
jgi:shikimate kinase